MPVVASGIGYCIGRNGMHSPATLTNPVAALWPDRNESVFFRSPANLRARGDCRLRSRHLNLSDENFVARGPNSPWECAQCGR
jgi:hypothetical protein